MQLKQFSVGNSNIQFYTSVREIQMHSTCSQNYMKYDILVIVAIICGATTELSKQMYDALNALKLPKKLHTEMLKILDIYNIV